MLEDLHQLRARAARDIDQGRLDDAEAALRDAAAETFVSDEDYASVLVPLAGLLARRGDARGALSIRWYLALRDPAGWNDCLHLLNVVPAVDRARTLAAMGRLEDGAREMEAAGLLAAAAIYRERAEDWRGARSLWSRLAQSVLGGGAAQAGVRRAADADAYSAALLHCNLARCARRCGDDAQAHEATVVAVRLLEEAADHFEGVGLRERAFDCFQVLIQLGREHDTFEDVVEGFVNCIRILREDHLKTFALQFLDDAVATAREREELSAAATLALEATQFARATAQGGAVAHYTRLQGELWWDAARQHRERSDSPEAVENALLAAVVAFCELGQFSQVRALYGELAALELGPDRQGRYALASKRYEAVREDPAATPAAGKAAPARRSAVAAEVWHVDLLEWEQAGSAAECCADVLLGPSWPTFTRRHALLARLTALGLDAVPDDGSAPRVFAEERLV